MNAATPDKKYPAWASKDITARYLNMDTQKFMESQSALADAIGDGAMLRQMIDDGTGQPLIAASRKVFTESDALAMAKKLAKPVQNMNPTLAHRLRMYDTPQWTTTPPIHSGWYWHRPRAIDKAQPVFSRGENGPHQSVIGYWWTARITPPKDMRTHG